MTDRDTILVFVPFPCSSCKVSHKRILVRVVNDFPQLEEIPDWALIMVEYIARYFHPSEVSDDVPCEIHSLQVAHYYLQRFDNNLLADLQKGTIQ